jgi:D-alanine--poly(phosphoribitol) ligase subunit 1
VKATASNSDWNLATEFLKTLSEHPDHNALHISGKYYTYKELYNKACHISAQIEDQATEGNIGILCSNSVWTYASVLAVLLNGGCYIPLNPSYPSVSLQRICESGKIGLILSEEPLSFKYKGKYTVINKTDRAHPHIGSRFHQPYAYMLFTSGTTGEPKSIRIRHSNLEALFRHFDKAFDFTARDKFLQASELTFDVSVFCMFGAWRKGACVYVSASDKMKYFSIIDTIRKHKLTVSFFVPTVLLYLEKYLPELSLPTLRYSLFSGDRLHCFAADKWYKVAGSCAVYNCYGPTETTIICTSHQFKPADMDSENGLVPMGKPFSGVKIKLVNEHGQVIKKGIGEICVSGPQVFDGYGDATDKKVFIEIDGERYYRSGDLGLMDEKGELQFEGRKDLQAKINGYRVQTLAIEKAIRDLSGKTSVVMVFHKAFIPYLVAFVEGSYNEHKELKSSLSRQLPEYMIPLTFLYIEEFPLNENGKISYSSLRSMYHE